MSSSNGRFVKEINLNNVRNNLAQLELATKPQLADATGLSVVTINSLVKELLVTGEIQKDETTPSTGGRPAATYRFNYQYSLALILLFNEHHWKDELVASVVDLRGETLISETHIIPVFHSSHFEDLIKRLLSLYPAIKIIAIGIPGQAVNGEITVSSHERLKGLRMVDTLQNTFTIPVLLENDVNAAVSGYCAHTCQEKNTCVVAVYFPDKYPPGVGIYLNGHIVKGKNGMAGEIKFLPLDVTWDGGWESEEFIEVACTIVQTLNAVLAPDQIVLYQNVVSENQFQTAWSHYESKYEMASKPDIILSRPFQDDFHEGIQSLALKELRPENKL
ncbi:ROK family protein [Alkalicoccobacillus porphyridii]|uniref:ROK family protein n=1 Tax=Alkalicoccobacillus porphyridii TaxID=2597270 RepID=UPI0021B10B2A|nr:ROK family protein [Alkalicoccobacillus porphyridii]